MRKAIWLLGLTVILFTACNKNMIGDVDHTDENPFFYAYGTPFETPPFDRIKFEHFLPAFERGIAEKKEEILKIANSSKTPGFENTIVALEKSGKLLDRVEMVFSNLEGANTNDSLQALAKKIAPMLSQLEDDMLLNAALFKRVKKLHDRISELDLDVVQEALLNKYYKDFVRGGANLNEDEKDLLREINQELAMLSVEFGDHVLKENNRFELVIDKPEDLAGLSENVISAASEAAADRGYEGKWVFTIQKTSMIPFLQFAENRSLRAQIYNAYINKGNHGDDLDNKELMVKTVNLRLQRANILGYRNHAEYILEKNMAKKPEQVYTLLNELWASALVMAEEEAAEMQGIIDQEGGDFQLKPWDWWYYAEKVKRARYDLDEDELRPYFEMENVRQGVFAVANKLYGITLEERKDIQVYHPDVKAFEVKEADGTHIGIIYQDYYPRASKRGGAWMNSYRKYSALNDKAVTPVVTNVCNFTKPTGEVPSLLSVDEVLTMFHEFGHGLHGLLSTVPYPKISGTSVPRDFVELPSQIMEHWALEPEVLQMYAFHYQTGEVIPGELVEKLKSASHFNQGFATVEYLAASILDMDWHTINTPYEGDPMKFEEGTIKRIGLMPEIASRYRSTYFNHIFAGGYSSGYYSYIWSEVLDSDAFAYFEETDIFDSQKSNAFRQLILASGGAGDPLEKYKTFRGREPSIDALLKNRGLKKRQKIEIL